MAKTWYSHKTKHDSVDICDCIGEELYRKRDRRAGEHPPWPNGMYDEDGYLLCGFCGLIDNRSYGIMGHPLSQCDTCYGFFKGIRRYFKRNYTCPTCEAKL